MVFFSSGAVFVSALGAHAQHVHLQRIPHANIANRRGILQAFTLHVSRQQPFGCSHSVLFLCSSSVGVFFLLSCSGSCRLFAFAMCLCSAMCAPIRHIRIIFARLFVPLHVRRPNKFPEKQNSLFRASALSGKDFHTFALFSCQKS